MSLFERLRQTDNHSTTLTLMRGESIAAQRYLDEPNEHAPRGAVLFDYMARFPDNSYMAIQVISDSEPDRNAGWCQGVLFDSDGREVGCTEPGDTFLGEYVVGDYTAFVCVGI